MALETQDWHRVRLSKIRLVRRIEYLSVNCIGRYFAGPICIN